MNSLAKVKTVLETVDVTKLAVYTNKIGEIGTNVTQNNAGLYLQDFILAYDTASVFLATAVKIDGIASNAVKEAEAIAFLDRAKDVLEAKGIKDSLGAREKCVHLDPDVQEARDTRAQTEALVNLMKNKVSEFRFAMEAVKKIAYTQEGN